MSDEFDGPELGLQWQWNANPCDDWFSLKARPGWLLLYPQLAQSSLDRQGNLLLQKFPAESFVLETSLSFLPMNWGEEAGLVVLGQFPVALGLRHDGLRSRVVYRFNEGSSILGETTTHVVKLRLTFDPDAGCCFSLGESSLLPMHFQTTKGTWAGARLGIYSIRRLECSGAGYSEFDYFRFK